MANLIRIAWHLMVCIAITYAATLSVVSLWTGDLSSADRWMLSAATFAAVLGIVADRFGLIVRAAIAIAIAKAAS